MRAGWKPPEGKNLIPPLRSRDLSVQAAGAGELCVCSSNNTHQPLPCLAQDQTSAHAREMAPLLPFAPLNRPCPPHLTNTLLQSQSSAPSPPYPPTSHALQQAHHPPKFKSFSPAAQNHPVHPSELLRRKKSSTQQPQIWVGTSTHQLFNIYQYPTKSSALDAAILQMP